MRKPRKTVGQRAVPEMGRSLPQAASRDCRPWQPGGRPCRAGRRLQPGCGAHPAFDDFDAGRSNGVNELRREKPQSIYPDGGIHKKRQPARLEAGLAAVRRQRGGNRVANHGQQPLTALELIEQRRNGFAVSQMATDVSDCSGHRLA
jgi:hypothetical protein